MRKVYLLLFCLCGLLSDSYGQTFKQKPDLFFLYANLGGSLPASTGFIGGDLVLHSGWSISVSYANSYKDSPNTPRDYENSFNLFGGSTTHTVQQEMAMWRFTVGRVWWVSPQNRVRFHLKGGVGIGHFSEPEHFERCQCWFTNYTYDRVEKPTVSLVILPALELPVARFFGFSLGIGANLNKYWKMFSLNLAINPGYFSGRRPPRT